MPKQAVRKIEFQEYEALAKVDELRLMVDEGFALNEKVKEGEKRLKEIRTELLKYAEDTNTKVLQGFLAKVEIRPTTSTEIEPGKLKALLTKMSKASLFYELLKVKITDAKKYLGEETLRPISKTTTEEYGSISYKKL
jgi:hypothetical protein